LVKARENDVDIFVMCTGPCNYCEVCSFKKGINCPHPEMSIPSVSGYGIPVRDMLKEIGHESKHDDKRIELFGLILYCIHDLGPSSIYCICYLYKYAINLTLLHIILLNICNNIADYAQVRLLFPTGFLTSLQLDR